MFVTGSSPFPWSFWLQAPLATRWCDFFAHHHPLVLLLVWCTMADSAPSLRALFAPVVEVNRRLDSLLDIQWRLMELRNALESSHPDMAELLHQSTVGVQRTIQLLRAEQSTLLTIFLQTLQHYVHDFGLWPDLDRDV